MRTTVARVVARACSALPGWSSAGVVLFALLALPAPGGESPALLPDASQAQIDGRVAVGMWPARNGMILGPVGFTVHLAADSVLEEEQVFPAGTWFQPPPGSYRSWVEGADDDGATWITPSFSLLRYSGGPFRGRGLAGVQEVVPAGRVLLDPAVTLDGGQSLRLLHLTVPREGAPLSRGFLRAITPDRAEEPVLMPKGRVIGLLYDRASGRYLAASPPVEVEDGPARPVSPVARRGVADLLVILQRPDLADTAGDLDLTLVAQGERISPDVLVPTAEWIYALWYDVQGRSARLEAGTTRSFLDPVEVALRPGGVETYRGRLRPRPHLDVYLEIPRELSPSAALLEVTAAGGGEPEALADVALPLEAGAVTRIPGLPASPLSLALTLEGDPIWKLRESVDLRDGMPREVVLRPDPIVLSGTVYHRGEPVPATVRLATLNEPDMDRSRIWVESTAQDDGEYELVLFAPGCYRPQVELAEGPGGPFLGLYPTCIEEDTRLDIRVPDAAARIRVRDATSGEPLPGALLLVQNDMDTEERRGSATQGVTTADDGTAVVSFLYPGSLQVWAEKDGYLRNSDPFEVRLTEGRTVDLIVTLEPVGAVSTLRLELPDGRPAAGAEVRAQRSAWNESPLWEGRADERGELGVPSRVRGSWLLVRHPEAGAWIQGWAPPDGTATAWTLPPLAGAVTVRTVGFDGEPLPWTTLAVRLPNAWVAGRALAWLTGTPVASSNAEALWTAPGLPARGLAVLAGSHQTLSLALQGLIDGSARSLAPPWPPGPVEVVADRN